MIEKLISLKGVGLLQDPLRSGALKLQRTVAIYSDNGRGKSTFSCVCRSLVDNRCEEIEARRTLGGAVGPHAEWLIDGRKHTLSQGSWDHTCAGVRVFDTDFVERNVCSGTSVEPAHRERLLEFAVGEQAATLKREIDDFAKRIAEQNDAIRSARGAIEPNAAPYTVDEFLALPDQPPTEEETASADRALRDSGNAAAIAARPVLLPVAVPDVDVDRITDLLGRTLQGLTREAEELVREHVREHLGEGGEQWLRQGAEYMQTEECPFCGQGADGVDLIRAYQGFFSERYEGLISEIDAEVARLDELLSDEHLDSVALAVSKVAEVAAAWSDQNLESPSAPFGAIDACRRARSELSRVIERKAASPLTVVALDEAAREAVGTLRAVRRDAQEFNKAVPGVNSRLATIKAATAAADQTQLRDARNRVAARTRRSAMSEHCSQYAAASVLKRQLETEKTTKRSELTEMTKDLLDEYCDAINGHLRAFGADFEVTKLARSDAGGTPRATYALRLMGSEIPLNADEASPSFSTTLSDGDRRLLGISFFLASLDEDPSLGDSTVVLDDPVCSFDIYRRAKMVDAIRALVSRGCQVIVLSHDADFVRMLRDDGFDMVLEIRRAGVYCVFDDCDIDSVCESEYVGHYRELNAYLVDGCREEQLKGIAKRIRPYLETNLRHRFPTELKNSKNLGDMIGAVKNRSAPSSLASLDGDIPSLEKVNEYAAPYHHNEGEKPVERELRETVELALALGRG